jgi:polysaccharide pyruvyl transferase WcaK-like protein
MTQRLPPSRGAAGAHVERPKIALFGIFGIQNLGNECTLLAMLHNVRTRLPEADLSCVCYGPEDTVERHAVAAIPITRRPSGNTVSKNARRGSQMLPRFLRIALVRLPGEIREWVRAVRALRGTDLLLMTGTGMLTDYSTSSFGYPYDILRWTIAARLAGCRVRFVGIGVGPLYERLSRLFVKAALALADYRSYRDDVSIRRLEKAGIFTGGDGILPDLAFSLPWQMFNRRAERPHHRTVVGVGVMGHFDPHTMQQQRRSLIYARYVQATCDFVVWLVEHGYAVRILQGDARHDGAVRRDVKTELTSRGYEYDQHEIIDEDILTVDDLVNQLAVCEIVVSPRFHNLLLALMFGVPVISISYDAKNDALLHGFGLEDYCHPYETINMDRLVQQFTSLERRSDDLRGVLRRKANECRLLLDGQYTTILKDVQAPEGASGRVAAQGNTRLSSRLG